MGLAFFRKGRRGKAGKAFDDITGLGFYVAKATVSLCVTIVSLFAKAVIRYSR